jgi:aldose 1-epimerase
MSKLSICRRFLIPTLVGSLGVSGLVGCASREARQETTASTTSEQQSTVTIKSEKFGQTREGQEVNLYTLTNENGMRVQVTNYGAIITSIHAPDKEGALGEVVLGFDKMEDYQSDAYMKSMPYFGGVVGRYGNRIAKGQFKIDGQTYQLATNNGENHLHGGNRGFDKVIWTAEPVSGQNALRLSYTSPDGEEGYPGNLTATVVYTLSNDNEVKMEYSITTDKATHQNLTNHSYFNLSGGQAEDALGHIVMIDADRYTVVDAGLIPTGENRKVAGSAMDFTSPQAIGTRIAQVEGGYDHNWVLNNTSGNLAKVISVHEPVSGRFMEVFTTEPGVQFYSGNFLDGTLSSRGKTFKKHYGFCLETQHFPDTPNQPSFPSTLLKPGETYTSTTVYKFSIREAL